MRKIFCLETEWNMSRTRKMRDRTSMLPLLTFLEESSKIEFVFRNVASRNDLQFYLSQLRYKTYDQFEIVYFAFHGITRSIDIPSEPEHPLELTELAELSNGLLKNRIIHFGSCRTLNTSDRIINGFKIASGARIVSGYTKTIDFVKSSILDIAYFSEIQRSSKVHTLKSRIHRSYGSLATELGFKLFL